MRKTDRVFDMLFSKTIKFLTLTPNVGSLLDFNVDLNVGKLKFSYASR